jgi:hypothetical protein
MWTAEQVLKDLVATINATGGLIQESDGTYVPLADPEWFDLAYVYLDACETLGLDPKIAEGTDVPEEE